MQIPKNLEAKRRKIVGKILRDLNRLDDRHTEEGAELGFNAAITLILESPEHKGLIDSIHRINRVRNAAVFADSEYQISAMFHELDEKFANWTEFC